MDGRRYVGITLLLIAGGLSQASTGLGQPTAKAPGLVEEGNYDSGNLGMQMQPGPRRDDAGPVYAVGPWPNYTPPLADGQGRDVTQSFCGICHSPTYITMQPPLPGATWESEVNKMIRVFGAPIPEAAGKSSRTSRPTTPPRRERNSGADTMRSATRPSLAPSQSCHGRV
jgi:hypothetical protein